MSVEKIYFVRHGETNLNLELRCQGRQDISLNDRGREQITATARKFRDMRVDEIYSSPLERARESARMIADVKGLTVRTLNWLAEIDHGALEGLNREESEKAYPGLIDRWHKAPQEVEFPGGETAARVAERVTTGLRGFLKEADGAVILVTHQVISGVARCVMEGLPLSALWENKLVNGGWFEFDVGPEIKKRIGAV